MPKILVSDRAQMVMSYHILFDKLEEERLAGKSFGSTKSGICLLYTSLYMEAQQWAAPAAGVPDALPFSVDFYAHHIKKMNK